MINYIFQYQLACESFYLKGTALWSDQYIGALYKTHLLPFKIGSCQPLVSNKYKKTRKKNQHICPFSLARGNRFGLHDQIKARKDSTYALFK